MSCPPPAGNAFALVLEPVANGGAIVVSSHPTRAMAHVHPLDGHPDDAS
ncbi:hypothetical protein THTE_1775 [Thermogutta terrifontis]|uniref:Uncharacterized protein n=1 Tax=Thermogutta terrifontis TaxID=1331910 RepID=A0A286REK5_9BACT|nr:hypothetical protein THTE_1775 [Thermogutta terrifontis]